MTAPATPTAPAAKRKCARCQGTLMRQSTLEGEVHKCITCGREEPVPGTEPAAVAKVRTWGETSAPPTILAPPPVAVPGAAAPAIVAAARPAPGSRDELPEWVKAARKELTGFLAAYAEVDTLKARAERIHAALSAYGLGDVPALPWKADRAALAGNSGKRRSPSGLRRTDVPVHLRAAFQTAACVECGYAFTHPREKVVQRRGCVCRGERTCAMRKAGAAS